MHLYIWLYNNSMFGCTEFAGGKIDIAAQCALSTNQRIFAFVRIFCHIPTNTIAAITRKQAIAVFIGYVIRSNKLTSFERASFA